MLRLDQKVFKKTLINGITVLIVEDKNSITSTIQLWYNVGSKDEETGKRGIAHLIEHMIYKGTKDLSEIDMPAIIFNLAGSPNAFTTQDYTGYFIELPTEFLEKAYWIMSETMNGVRFKEQILDSEISVTLQELRQINDNYSRSIMEHMLSIIFTGHPYHHPISGYKDDLEQLHHKDLLEFYKRYYTPDNSILLVSSSLETETCFSWAEKYFGALSAKNQIKKQDFALENDVMSKSIILHREVNRHQVALAYTIPGLKENKAYLIDAFNWLIINGSGSRLQIKLVQQKQLVDFIYSNHMELFDKSVFFIYFQPRKFAYLEKIIDYINYEIHSILSHGIKKQEISRIQEMIKLEHYERLQDIREQALPFIGRYYLATGNSNHLFEYLNYDIANLEQELKQLVITYFPDALQYRGFVVPFSPQTRSIWRILEQEDNQKDAAILRARERTSLLEKEKQALKEPITNLQAPSEFPIASSFKLNNNLEVFYHDNSSLPEIDIIMHFTANQSYDPPDYPGLANFVYTLLDQNLEHDSRKDLQQKLELNGIRLSISCGSIAMRLTSNSLEYSLKTLASLLTKPRFSYDNIQAVKQDIITFLEDFWTEPSQFAEQIIREKIFKNHPASKPVYGTLEGIYKITHEQIINFYKKYITPNGTRISIVGDLKNYNIEQLCHHYFSSWQGPEIEPLDYPALYHQLSETIDYLLDQDLIILCYGGLSLSPTDPDFDKILLFDEIFTGISLGNMSAELFKIRQQTGFFYNLSGSLLYNIFGDTNMVYIQTSVPAYSRQKAEEAFEKAIHQAPNFITPRKVKVARNAIIRGYYDWFKTNKITAQTFINMGHLLTKQYFNQRIETLNKISAEDIAQAVPRVLNLDNLFKLRIGRIN